jgi:hypothetical protein
MTTKTKHTAIIPGEGTDQQQRFMEVLNPETISLIDLGTTEWMKFARKFSAQVNFFDLENKPDGNWEDFFVADSDIKSLLENAEASQSLNPHLALFVCFLKLLDFSKKHFNQLTQRHLDFYYREILRIDKLAPVSDQVHVIFELAKNISQEKIDAETALDAGKDTAGKKLVYKTTEELVANKTTVAQLKNIYHHSDAQLKGIKACEVANSSDGQGAPAPSGDLKWYPFGYLKSAYTAETPELPDARLGFTVASPVLLLKEGIRTINLKISFKNNLAAAVAQQAEKCLNIWLSGEKKWLGPFKTDASVQGKDLNFVIALDESVEPIIGYNPTVLGERLSGSDPVMRFVIDLKAPEGYPFYTTLSAEKIKSIDINVSVSGIKSLELENDLGLLNAKKPFMPFGPTPLKGSRFIIKNQEALGKQWDSLNLTINWMNTPDSLKSQYFAYRTESRGDATVFDYRDAIKFKKQGNRKFDDAADNLIVSSDAYFKAAVSVLSRNKPATVSGDLVLFTKVGDNYQCQFSVPNNQYDTTQGGELQLSLNQSFLQEMYPRIYTMALQNEKTTLIPKEPYVPMIESMELSYSATAKAAFNQAQNELAVDAGLKLFHEQPFGQPEKPSGFVSDLAVSLFPNYPAGGELYIGLKDAEPLQQVSLLFQIFEGSENPESTGFAPGEKMEWSILSGDNWQVLNSNYLIANRTDNFLKSGIVKFSIPESATKNNCSLPDGLHWIRVRMNKPYDTVCKIIDIKAQAVLAEFENNGNELSHLGSGIPAGTIAKLVNRVQEVKSVSQPFNSFGGLSEESDAAFYLRVSERLRHKNRAITLWDYERLILQQFPEIHKARCLNHTSATSFLAPGNVTVVVIPDIVNRNVFDIYQPRVSRATLNKVYDYLAELSGLHVNLNIINPEYEEVTVSLKVRFNPGFDENYYKKILEEDLTKMLSPWAFGQTTDLRFGTTLHQSVLLSSIEKLAYVDYITDLKISHKGEVKKSISPSNLKAILVSAKAHNIEVLSNDLC